LEVRRYLPLENVRLSFFRFDWFFIIRESAAFLFGRRRAIFSEMGTKKEANAER